MLTREQGATTSFCTSNDTLEFTNAFPRKNSTLGGSSDKRDSSSDAYCTMEHNDIPLRAHILKFLNKKNTKKKHHSHAGSRQTVGIAAVGKPHFPCIEQKGCARMKIQIPAIFVTDILAPRSNYIQRTICLLRFFFVPPSCFNHRFNGSFYRNR